MGRLTPPSNFEKFVPKSLKEALATSRVKLGAFDLYVMEDGSLVSSAEALGEYVAKACLEQSPAMSRIDWIYIVVGITAHFARKQADRPSPTTPQSNS